MKLKIKKSYHIDTYYLSMFIIFLVLGSSTQVPEPEDRELHGFGGAFSDILSSVWSVISCIETNNNR